MIAFGVSGAINTVLAESSACGGLSGIPCEANTSSGGSSYLDDSTDNSDKNIEQDEVIFPLCSLYANDLTAFDATNELLFNISFYLKMNPYVASFFGADYEAVKQHWLSHGLKEGRLASPVFDVKYYLNTYPDLKNAFGSDYEMATRHWFLAGINEGRKSSSVFDVQYYVSANSDIYAAFGANFILAAQHWLNYGASECRITSFSYEVPTYLANNPDVNL